MRVWKACLIWFGNLPLRTKLHISFGWLCLFTVALGGACLMGLREVTRLTMNGAAGQATSSDLARAAILHITHQLQLGIALLLGFIVLLDVLMAWRLTQIISTPILEACRVLERLAQHDLTCRLQISSTDEVGCMSAALNRTIEHLHGVLVNLRDSADDLHGAASHLGERVTQASAFCQEQERLTQKMLTSTRDLATQGDKIAAQSCEAATASRESVASAETGSTVLATMAETMQQIASSSGTLNGMMDRLDERSQEISKAVHVIQGISTNTNLLALNAAIEAARAGEQGRGFAVVAGEVRRLAEHTRSAAEEIAQMVQSIQQETEQTSAAMGLSRQNIETGRVRADQAHAVLMQILERASRTESVAGNIAEVAGAQSASHAEIGGSAQRIAELAEGSLQSAVQVAQTGAKIRLSAEHLRKIVLQFQL